MFPIMVSVRLELTLLSKTELPVEVGVKGSVVSKEVLSIDHPKHGCNVATGTYKDLLVVRCFLQYASTIAKASLMFKCVVVDIKEPDSAASAVLQILEHVMVDKKIYMICNEDEPRPALNPHIQDI
ncbi:hypothetical protein Bca4012_049706 [Brassica carinata]